MLKGKLYMGSKSLKNVKVLDQQVILDYTDYNDIVDTTRKFGGCTILNGKIMANYQEHGKLDIYSNNSIRLLIPIDIKWERLRQIKNCLNVLGILHHSRTTDGYWLNSQGYIIWDKLEMITFHTHYTTDRFNFILSIMDNLKYELNQESMGMFWNEQLILI